jgi:hypothetical protein
VLEAPAKPYRLGGRIMTTPSTPLYREIQLTQGQVALVSAHRFQELSAYKWYAHWSEDNKSFYATRTARNLKGRLSNIAMHRHILGLNFGDSRHGEHRNMDSLDNRDENLRIATVSQNNCNRRAQRNNKSGFKGVSWCNRDKKWIAHISISGKQIHLGMFDNPELAFAAYCAAAQQLHGEFARTK